MSAQDYLKEFIDVTIQSISQQVESKNMLPRPQVAFLKDGKVNCERISLNSEEAIGIETQRFVKYWKENRPDAALYTNSGKITLQGHYEIFDQYKTDLDYDNHQGDFAVLLVPIAPILKNFGCLLNIFMETPSGYKYQESRGGHELDEITKAFGERLEKVVQ